MRADLDLELLQAEVDRLQRDPVARQVAEIAARTGRPFSIVEAEFTFDDLVVDRALQIVQAEESRRTCHQCGTSPRHFESEDGRPVDEPALRFELWKCDICEGHQDEIEQWPEKERPFVRLDTIPRGFGDPKMWDLPDRSED